MVNANVHTIVRDVYDEAGHAIRTTGGGNGGGDVVLTDIIWESAQTDTLTVRDIHPISDQSYGRVTTITNVASVILVADTLSRDSGVLFANVGDYIVYLGFDGSVTINNGMPLYPREKLTIPTTAAVFGIIEEAAVNGEVSYMAV